MNDFDCKILPEGVEIFQQSESLTLCSIRQNNYLCKRIISICMNNVKNARNIWKIENQSLIL